MPYVRMTWANRKWNPDEIELIHAWDEYCIDQNEKGYEESLTKAIESWGDDLLNTVTVEVQIPFEPILNRLNPPALKFDATTGSRNLS